MDYLPWLWYQQLFLETPGLAIWGPGRGRGSCVRTASDGGRGAAVQPLGLTSALLGPGPGTSLGGGSWGPGGCPCLSSAVASGCQSSGLSCRPLTWMGAQGVHGEEAGKAPQDHRWLRLGLQATMKHQGCAPS